MRYGARFEGMIPGAGRVAIRRAIESLPRSSRVRQKLARTFFTLPADLTSLYLDNFAVFSRQRLTDLWSADARHRLGTISPYTTAERYLTDSDATTLLDELLYVDIKTYLHELLMKQDQMSMAASIESRVPFLDHELVEFAASLPDRMKVRGLTTKYVLRQAMTGLLPAEILSRKKMGFPVPVGEWLRGPYRFLLDELLLGPRALARGLFDREAVQRLVTSHVTREANHTERLWSLLNLELWQRLHLDAEPIEELRRTVASPRTSTPFALSA
jgi:asparagine synthase (glutamine-hydrolysing)